MNKIIAIIWESIIFKVLVIIVIIILICCNPPISTFLLWANKRICELNFTTTISAISLLLTGVVTIISFMTLYKVLSQDRIDKDGQKLILHDIIRHLYRNRVVIASMIVKYESESAKKDKNKDNSNTTLIYPAEDHYHKLRLLDGDLFLEKNYRDNISYKNMHRIYLNMRNLGDEINSALLHAKNINIDRTVVVRDLENIDYKICKIHKLVVDLLIAKSIKINVFSIIKEVHDGNKKQNNIEELHGKQYIGDIIKIINKLNPNPNENLHEGYCQTFGGEKDKERIKEYLIKDVKIECGNNSNGSEKILIIRETINTKNSSK